MSSSARASLGEIVEVVMGQAPPGADCNTQGRGHVFVKAGEFDERRPIVREWTTNPLKVARRGDVLVCVVGATAGKINEAIDCAIGRSVAAVRPDPAKLLTPYLYHFLLTHVSRLRAKSQGMAQGVITREMLQKIVIPLPPLSEQRRIAEILEKADALRAKRRAALAQLDTLTQSIFLDMFGDPATNPMGIRKQPLGELIKLKSGDFLSAVQMAEPGTYPVLGGNGVSGFHDQYKFEDPQIVIGRVGAYCGCVHVAPAKSWITDNALYVSERDPDLLFEYLVHALTHARLNQYASQFGQPLVSGSRIYPVPVLVPRKEAQQEFVARAARSAELEGAHKRSLSQLDGLFASLQHRAFRGEL